MITFCPYCDYEATEHETLDGGVGQKDGDVSVCINCGEVSLYQHNFFGGLKKVDVSKLGEETQNEVKKIQKAWLQTKSLRSADKKGNSKEGGKNET